MVIPQVFDRQVSATPEAVAIVSEQRRVVTYSQLQQAARRIAAALRNAGVGPDTPVPLAADRSPESVAGLLGILMSGGAYVPINPRDPDERIATIASHVAARVAVAPSHLSARLAPCNADIVEISDLADVHPTPAAAATCGELTPRHLATIIYTSGTTGAPKGVAITHGAIMARMDNGYRPRKHDLQKAQLNVAAHFSDLLLPLLCGGPVIFAPAACFSSGRALLETVIEYGTTRMVFVPSQMGALLESGGVAVAALARLDTVIVSGEPLTPTLVGQFTRLLPGVALMNGYGATEVAGLACMGGVTAPDDITVGTALPGCTVHVLDDALEPVPSGQHGEIHLGGPQLASGYWRNPALTAERFVRDPFSADGGFLYRTGDQGERLPCGRVRVLGRRDFEVKVRGFRVSLHEIEDTLELVPAVHRAIVTTHGDGADQRLTAHVVPHANTAVDAASLRAAAASRLPAYMVPHHIRVLDALPLLANGKADRVTLTRCAAETPLPGTAAGDGASPSTPTERRLASLWRELIGVTHVGADDDFFGLGGDSLDAQRFVLRAQEAGVTVTLEQLTEAASLRELALAIDAGTDARTHAAEEVAR